MALTPRAARFVTPGLLAALAAAVRFAALGNRPLWLDEAYAVLTAHRSPSAIVEALWTDGNPPGFYWLLHLWTSIFGTSEAAVRSLPALFGVAAVLAVWFVGRRVFPDRPRLATLAALVLAVSPLDVYYAHECRAYALMPLLGVLALGTLHEALTTARARPFLLHGLVLAIGLYVHNWFLFLLPLGPAAALLAPGVAGRGAALRRTFLASALATLAFAPWIPHLVAQGTSGAHAWIPPVFNATPPWAAVLRSVEVLGVGGAYPGYLGALSELPEALPLGVGWGVLRGLGVLLAFGILLAGDLLGARRGPERQAALRVVLLVSLPLVLPWLVSFIVKPIYVVGRYELVVSGGFALLVARGLDVLSDRLRYPLIAAWLLSAGLLLTAFFRAPPHELERRLAERLRDECRQGDVVVFPDYSRAVPQYYFQRWGAAIDARSFPAEVEGHLGWFDAEGALDRFVETRDEAQALAASLQSTLRAGHRVFLVDWNRMPPLPEVNAVLRFALRERLGSPRIAWDPDPRQGPYLYVFSL